MNKFSFRVFVVELILDNGMHSREVESCMFRGNIWGRDERDENCARIPSFRVKRKNMNKFESGIRSCT